MQRLVIYCVKARIFNVSRAGVDSESFICGFDHFAGKLEVVLQSGQMAQHDIDRSF